MTAASISGDTYNKATSLGLKIKHVGKGYYNLVDRNAGLVGCSSVDYVETILDAIEKKPAGVTASDGNGNKLWTYHPQTQTFSFPKRKDEPAIPGKIIDLVKQVNVFIEKADKAAEKAEQFYKSAGLTIKEIKEKRPDDWETIVRDQCDLGRSRAYELIAIADGRTTLEKVRAGKAESVKKVRAKSSPLRSGQTEPDLNEEEETARKEIVALAKNVSAANREAIQYGMTLLEMAQDPPEKGDTPQQRWEKSLGNLAGEAISLSAYWTKQFGDWEKFDKPQEIKILALEAMKAWAEIVAGLLGGEALEKWKEWTDQISNESAA